MPEPSLRTPQQSLLTIVEAAAYIGRNVAFVRRLVSSRQVAHYKTGGVLRFRVADLDDYMASCRVEAHR
jgi:excisionase family DNA binding protein